MAICAPFHLRRAPGTIVDDDSQAKPYRLPRYKTESGASLGTHDSKGRSMDRKSPSSTDGSAHPRLRHKQAYDSLNNTVGTQVRQSPQISQSSTEGGFRQETTSSGKTLVKKVQTMFRHSNNSAASFASVLIKAKAQPAISTPALLGHKTSIMDLHFEFEESGSTFDVDFCGGSVKLPKEDSDSAWVTDDES
ncbi:hypothetical protein LTR08_002682 [Meristemomyces frigidus]|nr:hypothetical protein LTR08_002682 [Meristemomyces frigidus]